MLNDPFNFFIDLRVYENEKFTMDADEGQNDDEDKSCDDRSDSDDNQL